MRTGRSNDLARRELELSVLTLFDVPMFKYVDGRMMGGVGIGR